MFVQLYGADERYDTPHSSGVPTYENAKQVIALKRRLISLYAFNSGGSDVYLKVQDSANAGTDNGPLTVFPIVAGQFLSLGIQGGERFENGIYLRAFTEAALTNTAGNVMLYKVRFTAYH